MLTYLFPSPHFTCVGWVICYGRGYVEVYLPLVYKKDTFYYLHIELIFGRVNISSSSQICLWEMNYGKFLFIPLWKYIQDHRRVLTEKIKWSITIQ